jgi:predicted RNA-binding protein with PIN domain
MKCLIIDGYNAISKIREFDAKKDISLEASRLALIKALSDFKTRNMSFDKIIVVFDGKGEGLGLGRETYGSIEVLFSNKDKDADKVIIDMLKISSGNNRITVSSDDNSIKNHARAFSCGMMSIEKLEDLIILKKKASKSKIIEQDIGNKDQDAITNELKKYWGVK